MTISLKCAGLLSETVYSLRRAGQSAGRPADFSPARSPALSFRSRKPLAIGLQSPADVLPLDPITALVHDAGLEHRRRAGPMQIDPERDVGLGHAAAAADIFGHLARQWLDVGRFHGIIID